MIYDEENVIAPLEKSLRHIEQTMSQRETRLREIEREANSLKNEISDLKNSAEEIRNAMRRLLDGGRKTQQNRGYQHEVEMSEYDDMYDDGEDMNHYAPQQKRNQNNYQPNNYNNNSNNYQQQQQQPPRRSVIPMNRAGGARNDIPTTNPDIAVRSFRFRDRTITQACTILMRESGRPLHVNEIYNFLLEGGFLFTGNNPTISIAVSLNRNNRFRKVQPGTFDLNLRDASQAAS